MEEEIESNSYYRTVWYMLKQKDRRKNSFCFPNHSFLSFLHGCFDCLFQSFFERADQKRLQEYLSNGQEILKQLEPADQAPLQETMASMENRWKVRLGWRLSQGIACCNNALQYTLSYMRTLKKNIIMNLCYIGQGLTECCSVSSFGLSFLTIQWNV